MHNPHEPDTEDFLEQRLRRLRLGSHPGEWMDRYLLSEHALDPSSASARQRFEALARLSRDLIADRWAATRHAHELVKPKQVYCLSAEFLLGRATSNNLMNMMALPLVEEVLRDQGLSPEIFEQEPDASLGNGGLGRFAACLIESLATLEYAAMGYGLRYEQGMFRQEIRNGSQAEEPDNWLRHPDPWEIVRPDTAFSVPFHASLELRGNSIHVVRNRPSTVLGVAYDRPVVGYGARCVNTLRLWGALAPENLEAAGSAPGDFTGAVLGNIVAALTRVLYTDDATYTGRTLRFLQQYFLASCSLQDILARYQKRHGSRWWELSEHVAIQLNDAHPALAVSELMRLLLDREHLGWDAAWKITQRTLTYTHHALLPEALEKWPVELFEVWLPRQLEIIYEINRRFLDEVRARFPDEVERVRRASLIEEEPLRRVRMAHLAAIGCHSINGVAEVHTQALRTRVLRDFAELYPLRFNNKTSGVTLRRWLLLANPPLASLITELIGAGWVTDWQQLRELRRFAADASVQAKFLATKRMAKERFAAWLQRTTGQLVDPATLFDCHIKRIHDYERQLLSVLHIIVLYNRLRQKPNVEAVPRTFIFAGKAAASHRQAKLVIKLIHAVAATLEADPVTQGRLRVLFLPNYNVSAAEQLIPACDIAEQTATAGFEASGTSNMKLMMNGALTVGTRDGVTLEMAREVGRENLFLFGLAPTEAVTARGDYSPYSHYDNEPETREALNMIFNDYFSRSEPGAFASFEDTLLRSGDYYLHLADLRPYVEAQSRAASLYATPQAWAAKALLNIAGAGRFSMDRTVTEYAAGIWNAKPSPVP